MGKRFVTDFIISQPAGYVETVSKNFLTSQGFSLVQYKGEYVWRKGTGLMTAPQFIKLAYINGSVHIEAWLCGIFGGEMGLTGFYGAIPKSILKGVVDNLIRWICQPAPNQPMPSRHSVPKQPQPQ